MLIAGSRGRRVKDKIEMARSTGGMAEGSTVYNGPCCAARHTNSVSANPRRSQTLCIEVARMCSSAPLLTWRSFFFSVAWNHARERPAWHTCSQQRRSMPEWHLRNTRASGESRTSIMVLTLYLQCHGHRLRQTRMMVISRSAC